MRRARPLLLLVLLALPGCGYFNSLYNANRRFSDAERSTANGETSRARAFYGETIEKASVSYRKYPTSRWADDALLLIARSHFALGHDEQSAAALRTLLALSADREVRGAAHAFMGAVHVRLVHPDSAQMHLDSAVAVLPDGSELDAFARFWRARSAFDQNRSADAWPDLEIAARHNRTSFDAALLGAARSVAARDSARFARSIAWLLDAQLRGRAVEPVSAMLRDAALRWSPSLIYTASLPLETARWSNALLDSMAIARSQLAAMAGDTARAIELATRVANANRGGIGSAARLHAGQLMLARAATNEDLDAVRAMLLPAFDDGRALALMRAVMAGQVLMERGSTPANALSLFAAAEMARDELDAPRLARRLFLDYARTMPTAVWAGKAVLAAHSLHADEESLQALTDAAANPYIQSAHGRGESARIDQAEERLALGLAGLRADAVLEAGQRDVVVGRALTNLDSTRTAARNDSVRISCGIMIDSVRVAGIRADSVRIACLRGDAPRIAIVLAIDTVLLRDTSDMPRRPNEIGLPRPGRVRPDTIQRSP